MLAAQAQTGEIKVELLDFGPGHSRFPGKRVAGGFCLVS